MWGLCFQGTRDLQVPTKAGKKKKRRGCRVSEVGRNECKWAVRIFKVLVGELLL